MDVVTVAPNVWTLVAGLEVRHEYGAARSVEVISGRVLLAGEWQVRPVAVVARDTTKPVGAPFSQPAAPGRLPVRNDLTYGPVFTTRYTSECGGCLEELGEGEEARMLAGEAMHRACAEESAE